MGVHNKTLALFLAWLLVELLPAFISKATSNASYWLAYLFSEDAATIFLAMAWYTSLTYSSTLLKSLSFSTVIVAITLLICNIAIEVGLFPASIAVGIIIAFAMVSALCFLLRFIFFKDASIVKEPDIGTVYMVINKPANFIGLIGLFWSGKGGALSIYIDGYSYRFSREEGILVKRFDPDYCKGKRMINCGPKTPEKVKSSEILVGQKWFPLNNCITVFSGWHRKWT